MDQVKWLNESEARAWRSQIALSHLLLTELERDLMQASGLSHPDYAVLVVLSESPERRLRMREVALQLSWSKSRLSHQVSRMEKRGLVDRQACGDDGRGAWVTLTEHGLAVIEDAAPSHVESVRRHFFDHLTPEQVQQLGEIYEPIINHLLGLSPVCDAVCDEVETTEEAATDCAIADPPAPAAD